MNKLNNKLENITKEENGYFSLDTNISCGYKGCGSYVATIKHNKVFLLAQYSTNNDADIYDEIEEAKKYDFNVDEEIKALKYLMRDDTFIVNGSSYQLWHY